MIENVYTRVRWRGEDEAGSFRNTLYTRIFVKADGIAADQQTTANNLILANARRAASLHEVPKPAKHLVGKIGQLFG